VADTLIDKVAAIEARADELVERARDQVKQIETDTAHRLIELQRRGQQELERRRRELREKMESSLQQALEREDARFKEQQEQVTSAAEPKVEAVADEVARRFYQTSSD